MSTSLLLRNTSLTTYGIDGIGPYSMGLRLPVAWVKGDQPLTTTDDVGNKITFTGGSAVKVVQDTYGGNTVNVLEIAPSYNNDRVGAMTIAPKETGGFNNDLGDFTLEFWSRSLLVISEDYMVIVVAGDFCIRFDTASFYNCLQSFFMPIPVERANGLANKDVATKLIYGTNWHHIAHVRSNGIDKLYFDGKSTTENGYSYGGVANLPNISIGLWGGRWPRTMRIHDFRYHTNFAKYKSDFTPSW